MAAQQRRMTLPATLTLPEGASPSKQFVRPPSPLRNGFTSDQEDEDDDDRRDERWPSSTSSVSQLATNLANKVGSIVQNISPRAPGGLPTDVELEAEAQRERDRSRREAELILMREAEERRRVEQRVLAMMESARMSQHSAPHTPSPSGSPREKDSWWTATKNKLTPTKDPITPAQQVIHDTKAREKEKKKTQKEKDKDRNSWPTNVQTRYADPAYLNLANAAVTPSPPPMRKPLAPVSLASPTPVRTSMAPILTPSPRRAGDTSATGSPSRDAPPLYAQFDASGVLDMPATLLTIAKRFEKLEKWTVGHVRALEERMSDVERWLVDKEKEKDEEREERSKDKERLDRLEQDFQEKEGEKEKEEKEEKDDENTDVKPSEPSTPPSPLAPVPEIPPEIKQDLNEIREELNELQGRVGELGREMARTAMANLSSGPSRRAVQVEEAPQMKSTTVSRINNMDSPSEQAPQQAQSAPQPQQQQVQPSQQTSPQQPKDQPKQQRELPAAPSSASTPVHPASPPLLPTMTGFTTPTPAARLRHLTTTARESTSPPMSSRSSRGSFPTRLPYPTGDYASPPGVVFSPTSSPPQPLQPVSSLSEPFVESAPRSRPLPIAGAQSSLIGGKQPVGNITIPSSPSKDSADPEPMSASTSYSTASFSTASSIHLGRRSFDKDTDEDDERENEQPAPRHLPAPPRRWTRQSSLSPSPLPGGRPRVSPTPRKRYTVALGGLDDDMQVPKTPARSSTPLPNEGGDEEEDEEHGGETIGKRAAAKIVPPQTSGGKQQRARPQSAYSYAALQGPQPSIAPLRLRSQSTERVFAEPGGARPVSATNDLFPSRMSSTESSLSSNERTGNKFVDPLILRRQERQGQQQNKIAMPKPVGRKVPVGQLVAFFDGDSNR